MVCLSSPGVLSNSMGQPIGNPTSGSSAQNRLPAFGLIFGFPTCSAVRMLTEFSRQEHVPFQNIFQSISSGPGYALRWQPGVPECGGSSHSGRSYRGRRSYELSFDPSPLRGETRGFRRLCKNTTGARTFLSASTTDKNLFFARPQVLSAARVIS